jgi:hypothetical protein
MFLMLNLLTQQEKEKQPQDAAAKNLLAMKKKDLEEFIYFSSPNTQDFSEWLEDLYINVMITVVPLIIGHK